MFLKVLFWSSAIKNKLWHTQTINYSPNLEKIWQVSKSYLIFFKPTYQVLVTITSLSYSLLWTSWVWSNLSYLHRIRKNWYYFQTKRSAAILFTAQRPPLAGRRLPPRARAGWWWCCCPPPSPTRTLSSCRGEWSGNSGSGSTWTQPHHKLSWASVCWWPGVQI